MPRPSRTPLFVVAASPSRCAELLGIKYEVVKQAIERGELECHRKGTHLRILISELAAWVKTWPRERIKQAKNRSLSHG